ncbi:MAG: RNA methyltransferase [Bacteroidales bacterium]|nr:RNA methyltransferase [Bacteroidales bacterium]
MISKNQIKIIRSLKNKKSRIEHQCFVVEGTKSVLELIAVFQVEELYCTTQWLNKHRDILPPQHTPQVISVREMEQISFQKTPQEVLAVCHLPEAHSECQLSNDTLYLALDGVQDPGNVGTIVRLADWFGIKRIYASTDVADVFAPKCVQATMGSLARVEVIYTDLAQLFATHKHIPIYGTHLEGTNLYETEFSARGVIVMGSEGQGISRKIEPYLTQRLLIPHYSQTPEKAESLNVAIAAAIVCAEFRRR